VFIDYSYLTGCFLDASIISKGFGIFAKIYLIFPFIIYSVDAPAPPTFLGKRVKTVSHITSVSIIAEDISALRCSPNTSVPSFIGKFLIYSRELSKVG
jgi:hypothetical protein